MSCTCPVMRARWALLVEGCHRNMVKSSLPLTRRSGRPPVASSYRFWAACGGTGRGEARSGECRARCGGQLPRLASNRAKPNKGETRLKNKVKRETKAGQAKVKPQGQPPTHRARLLGAVRPLPPVVERPGPQRVLAAERERVDPVAVAF